MARNVLGSLVVSLGLDAAQYFQGLSKSEYQAKKFADTFNRTTASIASGLKGLAGGLAAGFSGAAIVGFLSEAKAKAADADRAFAVLNATLLATKSAAGLTAQQL